MPPFTPVSSTRSARAPRLPGCALPALVLCAALALPRGASAQGFTLGARLDFAAGTNSRTIMTADLNQDGWPDLVTANPGANTVSVMLGRAGSVFGAKVDYATGTTPNAVWAGDMNGDGKLDLVTLNTGANSVSVLLGDGHGVFGAKSDQAVGNGALSGAFGDLNGDGVPDLAIANYGSGTGYTGFILPGNGTGGFGTPYSFMTGTGPFSIAMGDLNNDGLPDLVTANYGSTSNTVSVLLNGGYGVFASHTEYTTGNGPVGVALGDLNGDGKLDLATANYGAGTVSVLLGTGTGAFGAKTDFVSGTNPYGIAIGDADGDGVADVVVANIGAGATVLAGNNTGAIVSRTNIATASGPTSVVIADLNRDGRTDLATANYFGGSVSVLLAGGAPRFGPRAMLAVGGDPVAVAVKDVNGDGYPDVITANTDSGSVSILLSSASGTLSAARNVLTHDVGIGNAASAFAVGDLNGDGKQDIVTIGPNAPTLAVLLGDGTGGFALANAYYATGQGPVACLLGDVNGDGKLDAVTANSNDATVSVLFGNGNGGFSAQTTYATPSLLAKACLGDVNGDGKLDIVTISYSTLSVLLNNGNGTFAAHADIAIGGGHGTLALADLNGDGKLDIVAPNYNSGIGTTVQVLIGNGSGGFAAPVNYTTGTGPNAVAVADVNGDSRPDIVVSNSGGTVSVLLGDGTGAFAAKTDFTTGSVADLALGDLNLDGRMDLVVANTPSSSTPANTLSVLPGLVCPRVTVTSSPAWTVTPSGYLFLATVAPPASGMPVPGGTLTFYDGVRSLGTSSVSGGTAAIATAAFPLVGHTITGAYSGDAVYCGARGSLSMPSQLGGHISGIHDVAGDQGGHVSIQWDASPLDKTPSDPITVYNIFRWDAASTSWLNAGSAPATGSLTYTATVATPKDSTGSATNFTVFRVHASNGGVASYRAAPDSGYSVDNLAPAAPSSFTGQYSAAVTRLHWHRNTEADFASYRLYRGTTPSFTPGAGNFIALLPDTGYSDHPVEPSCYKLTAVDVHGNESPVTALVPSGTTDVDGAAAPRALSFTLESVNPAHDGARLRLALPAAANVRLTIHDVAGRRVRVLADGARAAGEHTFAWDLRDDAGRSAGAGFYFARVAIAGGATITRRVAVVR